MAVAEAESLELKAFVNEPYTDFSKPENAQAMKTALARVRNELGRKYKLLVGGKERSGSHQFESLNPSQPAEVVGVFPEATEQDGNDAVQAAAEYFPSWAERPIEDRVRLLLRLAEIIRQRKLEFDAWLVFEAGKSWAEAEADVSEAVDFCEYYARLALKLAHPDPLVQLPGERDELVYLPLGVGAVIPPWNFPLAIVVGMTVAPLVTGNTVVLKPSSETPTIAAKFVEALLEAGFPAECCAFLTGSGVNIGELLVQHPRVRFVSFTGSKAVGLLINERASHPRQGQPWMKRVVAEMGGKDAIVIDRDCDLDAAVQGVTQSAFGFQGQKCSACSRAIVDEKVYDEFLDKLKQRAESLRIGPADDPGNYMGPVISPRARKKILDYIEIGKSEAKLVTGGETAPGDGYFIRPTIFADVKPEARIFQEEIFGPVLAVTKAKNFEEGIALANQSEYGLTGAVYTRDRKKIDWAKKHFFAGNLYINRKCTGAMVGAHPFGGFNMSGTDSKAGGPDYLLQFVQAKSIAEKIA